MFSTHMCERVCGVSVRARTRLCVLCVFVYVWGCVWICVCLGLCG